MEPEPSYTTSRPPRGSYTNGNDFMSLKVVPEQIQPSNFVYRFHYSTSAGHNKNKIVMPITDLDKIEATDDGIGISTTEAETVIMREVADWLHSIQSDDFWTHRKKPREILPTADQLLKHLRSPQSPVDQSMSDAFALDGLVDLIALQLLASCYTLLPASSASHLPLGQQRREITHITALRLHSKHRFAPAAGHHARPSSETEPWPGLYMGPSPEETLAEAVSKQRRLKKRNSEFIPRFAGSGWTDGPAARGIRQQRPSITDSSSSEEIGMLSRLICQPSLAKNPRRKHNSLFLNRRSSRRRKQKQQHIQYDHQPRSSPLQRITLQAVQRIPSALRLRRTQSAPRSTIKEAALAINAHPLRRHPTNPSIGSPISYPFEIPEIGRIGEYHGESWSPQASTTGSVRACGRGDLLVEQDYFGGSNFDWSSPSRRDYVNSLQPPHRYPNALSPSVISAVSPTNKRGSNRNQPASDYFGEMYSNKDVTHQKDDPHAAVEEHSDAGPELNDDPRLQKILGGILKDDTDSSDSGMESTKKRKSLTIMTESANAEVTERFKPHYDDGLPDFW